jgi:hypothetical protein
VAVAGLTVTGRDSNSILREHMGGMDRDPRGEELLRPVYAALDRGDVKETERLLEELAALWGSLDGELVELRARLAWAI